jgi:hypothetical protein
MMAFLWMRRTLMGLASLMPLAGGVAKAGFVLPSGQFTDLGMLNVSGGGTFATGIGISTPTLVVGGTAYDGQIYTYTGGLQAAVFQFDSITQSGGTLSGTGSLPVILLSYGAVSQTGGTINFDGNFDNNGIGGPGGGNPGQGPGAGGTNNGGSFGGVGSQEGFGPPTPNYGDLSKALQGGSGGGGNPFGPGGPGGGGLEIASNLSITLDGGISAAGGYGNVGGGGSGGGILLYAPTITNNTTLNVSGGDDGAFGGGGGGGRLLIDTAPGGLLGDGTLNVSGGGGQNGCIGGSGSLVILTNVSSVPEPSSLVLTVCGLAAVAVWAGPGFTRRRRSSAGS